MRVWKISPARCAVCGYYACYDELPVCSRCANVFQSLLAEKCRRCGKTAPACGCYSAENVRFLFFYGSAASKWLVYFIKYNADERVLAFLADMAVFACGINPSKYDGIVFVPRSKKNTRYYGYDQAKEMAKAISAKYSLPLLDILEHTDGGSQKLLSRAERIKNMKSRFRLKYTPEEKLKRVLLVDDVSTTGATVSACADLLRGSVSAAVTPLVIAKTNFYGR